MIYSLNEIDTTCKRAARGVGFEWGHAEEVGKMIRWLSAQQLPGICVLVQYFAMIMEKQTNFSGPDSNSPSSVKTTDSVALCPILTGAYLCDRGDTDKQLPVQFNNLSFPLLLLPYLAQLSYYQSTPSIFRYDDNQFILFNGQLHDVVQCDMSQQNAASASWEACANPNTMSNLTMSQFVEDTHWQYLTKLAHLTYVKATEASRLGAGPA